PLSAMMTPEDLMGFVKNRLDDKNLNGMVIFSGTIPILTGKFVYGPYFEAELYNPRTGKRLNCHYQVQVLDYLRG
ncbi:MAG: DUF2848 family protein, partial [Deltaproteobacteria bacterium]|nr:DUF2848 family protein [Deltaproteobacteria bacterium]